MTPGYSTGVSDERSMPDRQIEKQIGCMAGFRQLFDRHQILTGKRFQSNKSLPSSASAAPSSSPQSDKFVGHRALARESDQQMKQDASSMELQKTPGTGDAKDQHKGLHSPGVRTAPPAKEAAAAARASLPFEFKDGLRSPWKLKEAPRLSLDSRAIFDAKGSVYPREIRTNAAIYAAGKRDMSSQAEEENEKQRRSPSVVARLMGLETFPDAGGEARKDAELRRSASESRVSRDLMLYRFVDNTGIQHKQLPFQKLPSSANVRCAMIPENALSEAMSKAASDMRDPLDIKCRVSKGDSMKDSISSGSLPWNRRKSSFDSQDFFPDPSQTASLYGEIEKRLKMRGIDEPAKDLETLKQILEALQLKGLLHSKKPEKHIGERRNSVYSQHFVTDDDSIVVLKPGISAVRTSPQGRTGSDISSMSARSKSGMRRNLSSEPLPPSRQRRERFEFYRTLQSESRSRYSRQSEASDGGAKSPSSLARRKALSVETQRKGKDSNDHRNSYSSSQKNAAKKASCGSDLSPYRSSRLRKPTVESSPKARISAAAEDESSISDSSNSASSHKDCERIKIEEYKEGRSLLERCDKLLNSIAEITAAEQQPSPVSVLDSSIYKEDNSLSPIANRCLDFQDQLTEGREDFSTAISAIRSLQPEGESDEIQYLYVSEILSRRTEDVVDSELFALLEKRYGGAGKTSSSTSSKASRLHRRLIFDTVGEILDKKLHLSAWKAFVRSRSAASHAAVDQQALLPQVWSELVGMGDRSPDEELAVDLDAGDAMDGWCEPSAGMSCAVLDMERLIFKDLVGEAIRDLAGFAGKCSASAPRRKLAF